MVTEEKVRQIKRRHSAELLSKEGVSGVGVERDESGKHVLTVHVDTDDPSILDSIPEEIESCPVKIVHSGPFIKMSAARK